MANPKLAVVTSDTLNIEMVFEKETPGTWRFMEVDEDGAKKHFDTKVGTLYLKKSCFAKAPAAFTLTITPKG